MLVWPACASVVKSYMWRVLCQPVLLYGLECVNVSCRMVRDLETLQGNLVKQVLGLSKSSHASGLLQAMAVFSIRECVKTQSTSLMRHIFSTQFPVQGLTNYFLSQYIVKGELAPGTLVECLISFGLSPTKSIFNKYSNSLWEQSGVVGSLKTLLIQENFVKPYSREHVLAVLLTKSF